MNVTVLELFGFKNGLFSLSLPSFGIILGIFALLVTDSDF